MNDAKRFVLIAIGAWSVAVAAPASVHAQPGQPCTSGSVERLMLRLAKEFPRRTLATLDHDYSAPEPMLVVVEHSIVDETENGQVSSFGALEAWLTTRTTPDTSAREARPLKTCRKGLCVFDFFHGISHNHLYLHHVLYRCKKGRPFIEALFFLDGD